MKRLPPDASDRDILDAVREWVGLLAEERYAEAHAWLHHGKGGEHMTPELIAALIRNYGSIEPVRTGETFRVTPIDQAAPAPDSKGTSYEEVTRSGDGRGDVHYNVPLNGMWSDLTAILKFSIVDGALIYDLDDLHVL
jgi:hypothetical protein